MTLSSDTRGRVKASWVWGEGGCQVRTASVAKPRDLILEMDGSMTPASRLSWILPVLRRIPPHRNPAARKERGRRGQRSRTHVGPDPMMIAAVVASGARARRLQRSAFMQAYLHFCLPKA